MSDSRPRKMFVNLPVHDLARSKQFFGALGFAFDARFTDDKAACMVVGEHSHVMLLQRDFFATFTDKQLCDTSRYTEGLVAVTCADRAEVDDLLDKALAAGGTRAKDAVDHGFMYGNSFYDPDGHHWEVFWMDPEAAEKGCPGADGTAGSDARTGQ